MTTRVTSDQFIQLYEHINSLQLKIVNMKKLMAFVTIDDFPLNKAMYDRIDMIRNAIYYDLNDLRQYIKGIDNLDSEC